MDEDTPEAQRLSLAIGSDEPISVPPDAPLHDRVISYLATVAPGTRIRPLCIPRGQTAVTGDPQRLQVVVGDTTGVYSSVFTRNRRQGWGWITGAADVHGHLVAFSGPLIERPVAVSVEGFIGPSGEWSASSWLWSDAAELLDEPKTPGPALLEQARSLLSRTDLGPRGSAQIDLTYVVFSEPEPAHWSGVPLVDGRRPGQRAVASGAARALWGDAPSARPEVAEDEAPPVAPIALNATQRQAVVMARSAPLTVVSGPPGTGKTHLLAAIALEQLAAGRNALLVSASRTAVDAVDSMLRRFPAVTAIRFDSSADPVLLGNQLADGTDDGDPRFGVGVTERALSGIDQQIDQLRSRLVARLRTASGDSMEPAGGVDDLHDRYDELRELLTRATGAGIRGVPVRRRARKGLRSILDAGRSASLAELAERVDQIGASVVAADESIGDLWSALDKLEQERFDAAAMVLEARRRSSASPRARRSLGNLAGALRQSPAERRNVLWSADENFLGAAPLWFGTLDAVHPILPHQPEGFDLVVFDEASQISQIDAWPALERAKRVVVIGDSRQLRHVPHSADANHHVAAGVAGLSDDELHAHHEVTMSLFDVAAQRSPAIRLEEHFRSSPHIIGFSSERFYEGRLELMTNHPSREARDAIHIEKVTLTEKEAAHQSRTAEISACARLLQELLDFGFKSVGVIAASEDLAPLLKATVDRMPSVRRASDVRVGTVEEFQGLEFDATIIALGVQHGEWDRLRPIEEPTAFNVMVSRARRDVHVVTSLNWSDMPEGLLRDYLEWSEHPLPPLRGAVDATGWTGELARDLDQTPELRVVTHYPVGGHRIDIVIGTGIEAIGIETTVHSDGPAAHVERHLALRRAGWMLVDALEPDWVGRKGECAPWLIAQWKRRLGVG